MNIEIVIPTYKRPEKLARCLRSIQTALVPKTEVYVYYSNMDEHTLMSRTFDFPWLHHVMYPYEFKAARFWNDHLSSFHADLFIYLCDDTELLPDALRALRTVYTTRFPNYDGVVGFKQVNLHGITGTCPAAFGAIGRDFIAAFPGNRVFCEDFWTFYVDAELALFAKALGLFHWSKQVGVIHHHPVIDPGNMDETYHHVRRHAASDKAIWNRRQARNLLWGRDFTLLRGSD